MMQRKSVRSTHCSEKMWPLWRVYLLVILRFATVFNQFFLILHAGSVGSIFSGTVGRAGKKMNTAMTTELRKKEDKYMHYDRGYREIAFSVRYYSKDENNPECILKEKILQKIHQKMTRIYRTSSGKRIVLKKAQLLIPLAKKYLCRFLLCLVLTALLAEVLLKISALGYTKANLTY
jgi:hypothetical protein